MALIKLGGGVTDMRGSIGGTTFSRGAGGNIARSNKKPCTRHLASQNKNRARLSRLTEYWTSTLTEPYRLAWRTYAQNTSWTNRLAESIVINGLAAFIRLNSIRLQIGQAIRDAAPTANGHAATPAFTLTASVATQQFTMGLPTGFDKDIDSTFMVLSWAPPQAAGRIMIPPTTYWSQVIGSSVAPETFPWSYAYGWPFLLNDRLTFTAVHLDANFRVSAPYYVQAQAGA